MRQTTLLLCLALCAFLCAPAFCAEKEKPPEATVKGPGFHFTVALTKSTYLEGEPVLAKCSITNDLKKTQKLVEPDDKWEVIRWNVVRLPGREPAYHADWYPLPSRMRIPDDCFWEFRRGETKSAYVNLRDRIDYYWTQPGEYAVKLKYVADDHIGADWVGTLETDEILFRVVPATGKDTKAMLALRARYAGQETKELLLARATELMGLYNDDRHGRYAPELGYLAALALYRMDRAAGIAAFKDYVAANRHAPYYGLRCCELLGGVYTEDKNWVEVRKAYSMLPEGYWRDYQLQSCDRSEARARDANK